MQMLTAIIDDTLSEMRSSDWQNLLQVIFFEHLNYLWFKLLILILGSSSVPVVKSIEQSRNDSVNTIKCSNESKQFPVSRK